MFRLSHLVSMAALICLHTAAYAGYSTLTTVLVSPPANSGLGFGAMRATWIALMVPAGTILVSPLLFAVGRLPWPRHRLFAGLMCAAGLSSLTASALATPSLALPWPTPTAVSLGIALAIFGVTTGASLAVASEFTFRLLGNDGRLYGLVRVAGTGGYIAFCQILDLVAPTSRLPLAGAGVATLTASALSLVIWPRLATLPRDVTTPQDVPGHPAAGSIKEVREVLHQNRLLLSLALGIAASSRPFDLTHTFLTDLGFERPASTLSLAQSAEVVLLLALPFVPSLWQRRALLASGPIGWILLYGAFLAARFDTNLVYALPLQGTNLLAATAVAAALDSRVEPRLRLAAQGALATTLAVGSTLGTLLAGGALDYATHAGVRSWEVYWGLAIVVPLVTAGLLPFLPQNPSAPTPGSARPGNAPARRPRGRPVPRGAWRAIS